MANDPRLHEMSKYPTPHDQIPGQIYRYPPSSEPQWIPMTRVKFIYREQVIQVIEGENSRKGELSVITRNKDVPAHEVEHTVRRLANASGD